MSKSKIHKILKISAAAASLISALICAFAFQYSFDKAAGFFHNSPLTYIFYISLALTFAISIAAAITAEKQNGDARTAEPSRRLMAIIMICSLLFYLIGFISTPSPDYMTIKFASNIKINLFPIIIMGLIICLAHFVIIALPTEKTREGVKILTGLSAVFTPIIIATTSYFDHTQTLNSPFKLLFEFAFIAFSLYYICELRFYTDSPRRRLIAATSGISTALSLCAGVSVIFEMLLGAGFTVLGVATAILFATMAVCSAQRLLEP